MTEKEDVNDAPQLPSVFIEGLKNYDWLKIPGAVRGIAKLVTGTADMGAAWLDAAATKGQQVARNVHEDTEAHAVLKRALAKAAAKHAVGDNELVVRVIDQWAEKQFLKQRNREAVAAAGVDHLQDNGAFPSDTAGPSDDWMNVFEQIAERANSDALRDILGKVLAGEIREPGAFSFRTLQFMAILDRDLARLTQRARNWATSVNHIVYTDEMTRSPNLDVLSVLDDVGLVRILPGYAFTTQFDQNGWFRLGY